MKGTLTRRFYGLSSGCGCLHEPEQLPGCVALEAAADLGVGLLPGTALGRVVLGFGVVEHPPVDDDVQGAVELAIAAAMQSVALALASGDGDRSGPGLAGESGIGAEALGACDGDEFKADATPLALFDYVRRVAPAHAAGARHACALAGAAHAPLSTARSQDAVAGAPEVWSARLLRG